MTGTTLTRRIRRAAILAAFSLAIPNVAAAQMSSSSADPVLPDPVPNQGVQYPAGAVTADTAYGGPPRTTPHNNCAAFNPCAQASSDPHKLGPLVNESR
jgi:hypothetical protein